MIQFFRHIRKKLLSENRVSKYLVYAFGEIVLVVLGILIALQINTWNEQRKANKEEQALLREVHREFKENREQLDAIIAFNKGSLASCDSLLAKFPLKAEKSSVEYLIKYMDRSFQNYTFNASDGTINALINSSNLNLVKNDSLRRYLISWDGILEDYLEEEQNSKILLEQVYAFLRENITKRTLFSDQNLKIASDERIFNYLVDRKYDLQNIIGATDTEGLNEAINEIIRLTGNAINND